MERQRNPVHKPYTNKVGSAFYLRHRAADAGIRFSIGGYLRAMSADLTRITLTLHPGYAPHAGMIQRCASRSSLSLASADTRIV